MRIFPFTFALVSILFSIIYGLPRSSIPLDPTGSIQNMPNPVEVASNLANQFNPLKQDLGLIEKALNQAKQAVDVKKNAGLLHNLVPRIDNMINKVRGLTNDLTLGISEFAFKTVLGLPSQEEQ